MRFEKDSKRKYYANILDIEGAKVLGTIEYSLFPCTATIRHEGETYAWQPLKKSFRGSWKVGNAEEVNQYQSSGILGTQGTLTEGYLPPEVTMAGFYIHGYFFRKVMLSVIAGFGLGVLVGYLIN